MSTIPIWAYFIASILTLFLFAYFCLSGSALLILRQIHAQQSSRNEPNNEWLRTWPISRIENLDRINSAATVITAAFSAALMNYAVLAVLGANTAFLVFASFLAALILGSIATVARNVFSIPNNAHQWRRLLRCVRPIGLFYPAASSQVTKLASQPNIPPASPRTQILTRSPAVLAGNKKASEEVAALAADSMQLNMRDLASASVEDVMTPRTNIEAINIAAPAEEIRARLAACYHNKLPVYEGEINNIVGILHVRNALSFIEPAQELTGETLSEALTKAYFIPQGTALLRQLEYFIGNHERLGLIVDEYGDIQGLITIDDIVEEIIGDFTTTLPGVAKGANLTWTKQGECWVEGSTNLRDINKTLRLDFPLDGPKTINGLLLEVLRDIPESQVCVKLGGCIVEIIKTDDHAVKLAKLISTAGTAPS